MAVKRVAREPVGELPTVAFERPKAWATWLRKHHRTARGVWLRFAKKGSAVKSVTYQEALVVALCYGWIDGQARSEGAESYLQRFTPRTKKSIWSKINRARALALIESGEMQPAGLEEVERAKADGRWEAAYDSWSTATVPPDLQAALDQNPRAQAFWDTLNTQNTYAVLFRTHTAKKPETRAKRIQQFIEMLAKGEKLYP